MSTWIRYLLDTNILVRLANAQAIQYAAHFARYASLGPGLTAVHPSQV